RGELGDDVVEDGFARVKHESDAALRGDGGVEHQRDVLDLAALPRVGEGGFIGDELRFRFHQRLDNAQAVGAQAGAGLGDLDDGVGEGGRFHFRRAPTELDLDGDVARGEVA